MKKDNDLKVQILYWVINVLFWFAYAAPCGYTAVYLKYCGCDSALVGIITGTGAIISVAVQPLLASAVNRIYFLTIKKNIIILEFLSMFLAFLLSVTVGIIPLTIVLFILLTTIEASIPCMLSSMAMEYRNSGHYINYGLARGSGSMAYAISSLFLGYIVTIFNASVLMLIFIIVSVLATIMVFIFPEEENITVKIDKNQKVKNEKNKKGILKDYPFLVLFLISSAFLFMAHAMVNMFLVNVVESVGGNSGNLGISLFIAAAVELPVMAMFLRIEKYISVDRLLIICTIFFVAKSSLLFLAGNIFVIYISQFLQFGAYALYTPASVQFIDISMKRKDAVIGQALLGAGTVGFGCAVGNALGGIIADIAGVSAMILFSIILTATGAFFMVLSIRKYRISKEATVKCKDVILQ